MNPEDSERWVNHRAARYHDTTDCPHIKRPDDYARRPVWYVEERDLLACSYCHDDADLETGGGDNDSDWGPIRALRRAAEEAQD